MRPTPKMAQMVRKGLVVCATLVMMSATLPAVSAQEARGAGKLSGEVVDKVHARGRACLF